jgi:hypothetical protein
MRFRLTILLLAGMTARRLYARDLAPRAYLITPRHSSAVTLTWSYYNGGLNSNGAIPNNDARDT